MGSEVKDESKGKERSAEENGKSKEEKNSDEEKDEKKDVNTLTFEGRDSVQMKPYQLVSRLEHCLLTFPLSRHKESA